MAADRLSAVDRRDSAGRDFLRKFARWLVQSGAPDMTDVLRGGSWINNPDNARAAIRNRNNPDNRNNNIGFRVLSSAHITHRFAGVRACRPWFAGHGRVV
ncbi:MAG: SUMF1/EgtB/PvdO family nonheme iron enzyme [Gammaproteobacteria bacterium]|nr:SUMF1/EgtB/PvdO family nonheme iron enzyme [Gammaproteobacteria bacterium]